MKTLICVEGPDNTGKTTIAKHLSEKLDMDYHHFNMPDSMRSAKEEYFQFLNIAGNQVLDRCWIGEFVYGPILRHYEPDYLEEFNRNLEFLGINVFYVLLICHQDFLMEIDDGRNSKDILSKHERVTNKYLSLFNNLPVENRIFIYKEKFDDLEHQKDHVLKEVKEWVQTQQQKTF